MSDIPDTAEPKIGRPSKYNPSYANEVISLMSVGLSLTAAAAELGIHRDTVYEWEKTIPTFSDAIKLARGKRTLKLERDLLAATDGPTVTSRIFALKNACADEWREKVETDNKHAVTISPFAQLVAEISNQNKP